MAPRPRWWHQLQSSKQEALLAVDLYNRSGRERQLEAFIVHMSMAWLRLMQSKTEHAGGDLYVRHNGRRQRSKDGDWLMKPLSTLTAELLVDGDPVAVNLAFFTGLRHKIEHRYEKDLATLVAGRTQAHVLNYEKMLTDWFGSGEGLSEQLRFPIFVSSFSEAAVEALKRARRRVPTGIIEWMEDYDASVPAAALDSPTFDFRVYLIQQAGPKSSADAAMTFVRNDDLTAAESAAMDQVRTIIREKLVAVTNPGNHLPGEVVNLVAAQLSHPFNQHAHTQAWRYYRVRPAGGDPHPERTKAEFCVWDPTFKQHSYTDAWVSYLVRKLKDPVEYERVVNGTGL